MFTIFLLGLVLIGVTITVSPAWQSSVFRRTVNGEQHTFHKGQPVDITNEDTLFGLLDEIGAALVLCDENGKPDLVETDKVLMQITEEKLQAAESSGKPANLKHHQIIALQALQSAVASTENDETDPGLAPTEDILETDPVLLPPGDVLETDPVLLPPGDFLETDPVLLPPGDVLNTPLETVFPDKEDQDAIRLELLKASGVRTVGDAVNHPDLTSIDQIGKKTKNRVIAAVNEYLAKQSE